MKYFPITIAQEEIYYDLISLPKDKLGYLLTSASFTLEGDLDIEIFRQAANYVKSKVDGFQLRFTNVDDQIKSYFGEIEDYSIEYYDYTKNNKTISNAIRQIREFVMENFVEIENRKLLQEHIYKLSEGEYVLFVGLNHMVMDFYGYSNYLIMVSKVYNSLYNKQGLIEISTSSFQDEIEFDIKYKKSSVIGEDLNYWNKQLENYPSPINFFPQSISNDKLNSASLSLSENIVDDIRNMVHSKGISTHQFYMAVFYIMLSKLSGKEDLVLTITFLNRNNRSARKGIGLYVTAVPIRVKMDPRMTLAEFLILIKQQISNAKKHQKTSAGSINNIINESSYYNNKWKDISFTSRVADLSLKFGESSVTGSINQRPDHSNSTLFLEVDTYNYSKEIFFRLTYNEKYFAGFQGEKLIMIYENLLIWSYLNFDLEINSAPLLFSDDIDALNLLNKKQQKGLNFAKCPRASLWIDFEEFMNKYMETDNTIIVVNEYGTILPSFMEGIISIIPQRCNLQDIYTDLLENNLIHSDFLGYYNEIGSLIITGKRSDLAVFKGEMIRKSLISKELLKIDEIESAEIILEDKLILETKTKLSTTEIKSICRKVLPIRLRPKIIRIIS